ncbi:hypothetical protein [Ligilactobacillus ruminis]|uniref:hypothetical protein n=1 Tax=Ligilactobacillus ruminis TaxID=1623 RepID=UPI002330EE8C|nr:hypothetical protein [Ligilactobacillus ruminis]MDB7637771.1 hypothetical protein [Ligilactobacillus ruminis]MDB7680888.1 hypothetical protein [Ligilactobacillus ruminis]
MENARTTARRLTENELRKICGGKRSAYDPTHLRPAKSKKYCIFHLFSKGCR